MQRLIFLLAYIGLSAGLKFSIRSSNLVQEHGIEFEQVLSYDPENDVLKVEVPLHLNVLGSTTFFDRKQNLQLVYVPAHNYCKIEEFEEDFDPALMMRLSIDYQLDQKVLRAEDAKEVYKIDINTPIHMHEVNQLPDYVQDVCKGKEINRVQSVSVSQEEFLNSTAMFLLPISKTPQSRHKRLSDFLPICYEAAHLCTRKANWGRRCLWQLVNTEKANEKEIKHLSDSRFSCVMCCVGDGPKKYSEEAGLCKCDLIKNKEDFKGCQPSDGDTHRTG